MLIESLLWMTATVDVISGHSGVVWSVAVRPQQDFMLSTGQDKVIKVWSMGTSSKMCVVNQLNEDFSVHSRSIRRLAWRPDGAVFAAASFDAKVSIWRFIPNGPHSAYCEFLTVLKSHESEAKCVAFSPCGEFLATCSRDKAIYVYDLAEVEEGSHEAECVGVLTGHTQDVKAVKFLDSNTLVSCSYDESVKIWKSDGDDWRLDSTLVGHSGTVWGVDVVQDWLVTCSADSSLKLWKNSTSKVTNYLSAVLYRNSIHGGQPWKCYSTMQGACTPGNAILDIAWSSNLELLALAGSDNTVRIVQLDEETQRFTAVETFPHHSEINCVCWLKDGTLLAGSDDGKILVFKVSKNSS
jgi:cytosolic iron-sulfur protein assembly protein CIAO1